MLNPKTRLFRAIPKIREYFHLKCFLHEAQSVSIERAESQKVLKLKFYYKNLRMDST